MRLVNFGREPDQKCLTVVYISDNQYDIGVFLVKDMNVLSQKPIKYPPFVAGFEEPVTSLVTKKSRLFLNFSIRFDQRQRGTLP